mmetsp:Transcript_20721/g.38033  ORF Transcript_20721/g.38033 Transcript_20721/m.38033 type:complete len:273 (+) Transcript_20721:239-1057(+)
MMNRSFVSMYHLSLLSVALLLPFLSICPTSCHALANNPKLKPKTYNYFAFGSNMASSTMINLRNISPLASSAAILPGHALRFNIPGVPGVEPSSASVEPTNSDAIEKEQEVVVHGVLYKLTEEDFATICQTEGVPLAYSLHRCRVVPYVGDGKTAGEDALRRTMSISTEGGNTETMPADENNSSLKTNNEQPTKNDWGVSAFTLRAARKKWREGEDIPPSQSYLNVLIRGAKEFVLDESYLQKLENTPVGKTWIGNGLSEEMLRMAEQRKKS